MDKEVFGALVRHLITGIGGVLIAKGVIDAGQVELIAGAVASLAMVTWSIVAKKKSKG